MLTQKKREKLPKKIKGLPGENTPEILIPERFSSKEEIKRDQNLFFEFFRYARISYEK